MLRLTGKHGRGCDHPRAQRVKGHQGQKRGGLLRPAAHGALDQPRPRVPADRPGLRLHGQPQVPAAGHRRRGRGAVPPARPPVTGPVARHRFRHALPGAHGRARARHGHRADRAAAAHVPQQAARPDRAGAARDASRRRPRRGGCPAHVHAHRRALPGQVAVQDVRAARRRELSGPAVHRRPRRGRAVRQLPPGAPAAPVLPQRVRGRVPAEHGAAAPVGQRAAHPSVCHGVGRHGRHRQPRGFGPREEKIPRPV